MSARSFKIVFFPLLVFFSFFSFGTLAERLKHLKGSAF
uniref:Uncharacterized protein n=1 Tax=Anguilla anguilla TaxID=7936 RepID=A0A0E9WAG4_ANGAN